MKDSLTARLDALMFEVATMKAKLLRMVATWLDDRLVLPFLRAAVHADSRAHATREGRRQAEAWLKDALEKAEAEELAERGMKARNWEIN